VTDAQCPQNTSNLTNEDPCGTRYISKDRNDAIVRIELPSRELGEILEYCSASENMQMRAKRLGHPLYTEISSTLRTGLSHLTKIHFGR
jgi:hypothetical protein